MTALSVCFLAALCLVPGLPLAVLVDRRRQRPLSTLLVEGVFLGFASAVLVTIVVVHVATISAVSVGVPLAVVAVAAWSAAARHMGDLPRPRITAAAVAMGVVLVVALWMRAEPVSFLAQTADFGEYVNRGNQIVAGKDLGPWFLHLFGFTLALTHVVLGEAAAVDLMPFLGMLLLIGVVAVAYELGFGAVVRTAIAGILALHVVPVWFSLLPTSEGLYATLLVGGLLWWVVALVDDNHVAAAVAAVVVGLETVNRGNALLLFPALAAGLVVAAVFVERAQVRLAMTFVGVGAVATYLGVAYNARYSTGYFVDYNLANYLPSSGAELVARTASGGPFLLGLVVVLAATAALIGLLELIGRAVAHRSSTSAVTAVRVAAVPLLMLGTVLVVWRLGWEGLVQALGTYGVVLGALVVVGAGVFLWRLRRPDPVAAGLVVPLVVVGCTFAVLFAYRIPTPRGAPTFLYWDRYLYSELFPLLAVVALWGLAALLDLAREVRRRTGSAPWAVPAFLVAVGVAGSASLVASTAMLRQDDFFDDYYDQLAQLDELTGAGDDRVIVYSGVPQSELPPGYFHPNTQRVVATPLAETFERRVLNGHEPPFDEDQQLDAEDVRALLREAGEDRGYLLEVVSVVEGRRAPALPSAVAEDADDGPLDVQEVARTELVLPVLPDPLPRHEREWQRFSLEVVVSEVRLDR